MMLGMKRKMFSARSSLTARCGVTVTVPFMLDLFRVATIAAVLVLDFPMVANVSFATCLRAVLAPDSWSAANRSVWCYAASAFGSTAAKW